MDAGTARTSDTSLVVQSGTPMLSVEIARDLLAKAKRVDEVREIGDRAKAIALYLRTKKASAESVLDAIEIGLRAERRIGELLPEGGRWARETKSAFASRIGISYADLNRCERLAKLTAERFDRCVAEGRKKSDLSIQKILYLVSCEKAADGLVGKADPKLVDAVRSGRVNRDDAKAAVARGFSTEKQRALVDDPGAMYRERQKQVQKEISGTPWVLQHFEDYAESLCEFADDLLRNRAITTTARQKLQNAIDDVIKLARKSVRK